jgi:hypothetical protein
MSKYISLIAVIPVREKPSSTSEMVNSMLFGETCESVNDLGEWLEVVTDLDNYKGFVSKERLTPYNENLHNFKDVLKSAFAKVEGEKDSFLISCGSSIPESRSFEKNNITYRIVEENSKETATAIEIIRQFMNTPYLWGGKSVFGADCSGLIQSAFKVLGKSFPRDAYMQVELGEDVKFEDRNAGDLAYFTSSNGRVTHVGILSSKDSIIHSAGFVREDEFTSEGIFRREENKLTHNLSHIKRLN